jgi:hypothetical protein
MPDHFQAVYRNGTFHPTEPCSLPEDTVVTVYVNPSRPGLLPPGEPDPEKRRLIMKQLTERMQNNPIPLDAPPITREWLHERG